MLFIRFLRFLRGYICFTAADGFPERFLNLCNQAGVVLWETSWQRDDTRGFVLHGRTDRRGYEAMRACAEPAGVVLRAGARRGLPFFLHDYRMRAGLLAGLVLCVAALALLSGMVWTIDVQGNERVSSEEILRVMEAQGLRLGVRRKTIDAKALSEEARQQLPGVDWVALNLRGSAAFIEVREELLLPPRPPEQPQNIVASKAGQLKIIEIYMGSAQSGPGQAVFPGSLLAGGAVENADASTRYVPAQAYAVDRTSVACDAALPRRDAPPRITPHRTHYTLRILNIRIPLGPLPKDADAALCLDSRFTWAPRGKQMPLTLERRAYVTLEPRERIKNDRQLQLAACELLFDQMLHTLRAAQILSQEITLALDEDACSIALSGDAYENIGIAQPF